MLIRIETFIRLLTTAVVLYTIEVDVLCTYGKWAIHKLRLIYSNINDCFELNFTQATVQFIQQI